MKFNLLLLFSLLLISSCENVGQKKVGTYQDLQKELQGSANNKIEPHADIEQLESEVNNGGFNQYFFNESGQNCFATLRLLRAAGRNHTAQLLQDAINLINPRRLSDQELIDRLQKRQLEELLDSNISAKLNVLDEKFYAYPDGPLTGKRERAGDQ